MTTAKTPKTATVAAPEKSKLFRQLSAIFLISSVEFAKQSPKNQTSTLAKATTPIEFVPNFNDLGQKKRIRDNLLAGVDVSRELEFNEISLTDEEKATLKMILPILEKIGAIGPSYEWLPEQICQGEYNGISSFWR